MNYSIRSAGTKVEDSPISLLRLFKAEHLLQEQWQQALLYNAFTKGTAASTALQETPALPVSADVPLPFTTADFTNYSWEAVSMGSEGSWSLDAGSTATAVLVPAHSTSEPGLFVAASLEDNQAAAPVTDDQTANIQLGLASPRLSSSSQQQRLAGPALSDDSPIQQVLEAVPTAAHCPEAATAAPADCSTHPSHGSSPGHGRLAATAVDSKNSNTGQGSSSTPTVPLQGGGSSGSPIEEANKGTRAGIMVRQQSQVPARQSAKAADGIKEGIRGAREQIAARSKQLEYQSPGYEQLLDSAKRLLVALIAIAQFLIKVALAVGVVLVRGLVQLIQWFINLGN
jgi:hypothetical protein